MSGSFIPSNHPGVLHHYSSRLVAFEHGTSERSQNTNLLIWIGGLGDGLLTVPYTHTIAKQLSPNWSIVEPTLTSSYSGWGTSSLVQDAREIAECVKYFKQLRTGSKVVLMGHSTGSQDCMEYVVGPEARDRPDVQGIILQAGISDREGMKGSMPNAKYEESCKVAQQWIDEGRGDDVLPLSVTTDIFGSPCTASRWLSLASPNGDGLDDYFSSDLPNEKLGKTFGRMPDKCPLLILLGGNDQYMPVHVDREALAHRWSNFVKKGRGLVDEKNGGVVPGATHNLMGDPEHVVQDLVGRVSRFLDDVEKDTLARKRHFSGHPLDVLA